jgi:Rrf2 family cysteine metabolism transcriptional repressor
MISNKCHYALRAMLELAVRQGRGPVTIGEIAAAQNIPVRFLEAILRQLRQAGLCDSVRGKEGGYTLSREAESITVNEVIRLFEGPLVAPSSAPGRSLDAGEIFQAVWTEAEKSLDAVFGQYSFGHLAEREQQRAFEKASNYTI